MRKILTLCGFGAGLMLVAAPVGAAPITFTGSGTAGGVAVSATATFSFSGNQLTLTLQNTSPSNNGQDVPASTLTGIFFDLTGNPVLTPVSATLPSGSAIIQSSFCNPGACPSGTTNVGGEFSFAFGSPGSPGGAKYGISSSGYINNANSGNFNGSNLDDPVALDGINFGIVSAAAGFNPNGGLDSVPLIQDAVQFILNGVSGLDTDAISHVSFQYGTSLTEPNIPGGGDGGGGGGGGGSVPEPGTIALLAMGLLGTHFALRRRRAI